MEQLIFPGIALLALGVSGVADRRKTLAAIRVAWKRFGTILPVLLAMIAGWPSCVTPLPSRSR